MPTMKSASCATTRIELGAFERKVLKSYAEAENRESKAIAFATFTKGIGGGLVGIAAIGALGVGVYAAYTLAQAWAGLSIPNPLDELRKAGGLNPFKEKNADGSWYHREGGDLSAMGGEADPTRYGEDTTIGTARPYMPKGIFESDAHYDERLCKAGHEAGLGRCFKKSEVNTGIFG